MTEMSWLYWLTFNGLSAAGHTATPTLVLHSDGCVLPDHARLVHTRRCGSTELAWSEGDQVDFTACPIMGTGPWPRSVLG